MTRTKKPAFSKHAPRERAAQTQHAPREHAAQTRYAPREHDANAQHDPRERNAQTHHAPRERAAVERVYGLSAALAVMRVRPEQVLRIAHTAAVRKPLAPALREAARRRIAYREVEDDELAQMAGAVHHEGVCVLARPAPPPTLDALCDRLAHGGLLLALDGVDNPHNVGAVLRSAAFFGAAGMLIGHPQRRALSASTVRVAEGGAEHVPCLHTPELASELRALRKRGLALLGSDSHAGTALPSLRWPQRCVLVLGAEDRGLSPGVRALCTELVRIPGHDPIDSLNVAVAAGVLLAAYAGAYG